MVAYIINPVFAVDFMHPHDENPDRKPTFDKSTKRTLLIFAGVAVIAYLINFGFGNLIVVVALLYLLNHFYLSRAVEKFQTKVWPAFQRKYVRLLVWALDRPRTMLLSAVGLLFLSLGFIENHNIYKGF